MAAAYAGAGYLGLLVPAFGTSITLVWLPTGIAVAALLRWGSRLWIGVWLGTNRRAHRVAASAAPAPS